MSTMCLVHLTFVYTIFHKTSTEMISNINTRASRKWTADSYLEKLLIIGKFRRHVSQKRKHFHVIRNF